MPDDNAFSHIKALIWDLDNTLYKYEGEYREVFCNAAARAALDSGFDGSYDEAFAIAMDGAKKHALSNYHFLNEYKMPIERYHHDFHNYIDEADVVIPCIDTHGLFKDIYKHKDLKHCIVTHGAKDWAIRALTHIGLKAHFDDEMIISLECASFVKKHQCHSPFEMGLKRLEEDATYVAVIEDSIQNLEKPKELGMTTVWISHGQTPDTMPDYVDHSYEKLAEFLESL